MPPAAKRPRHCGASQRRDQASSSPEPQPVAPPDKPAPAIYKDYPALCALIGISVNDKVTMLQIRTRILEQCQALGVPLDQNYRSYPTETLTQLTNDVTTWWNTNYGSTERYLSLGVVDSIIHRLCLDKVRNSRARNRRKRACAKIVKAHPGDPSPYQAYPGRKHPRATEQDASSDEQDDKGGQNEQSSQHSEIEVRGSVTPPSLIDDSPPVGSASAVNDPSEISPLQSDLASPTGGFATPSRSNHYHVPADPGSESNVQPASGTLLESSELRVAPTPAEDIRSESESELPLESTLEVGIPPAADIHGHKNHDPRPRSATPSKLTDQEVPEETPSPSHAPPETSPAPQISGLRVSTPPDPAISAQLTELNIDQPPSPRVASLTVAAPPTQDVAPGGDTNCITLTMPAAGAQLTIPRSRSLLWLVSWLAEYFHHPAGGFTLGAYLQSLQLRLKQITTEEEWQTIVTDPQITELTIIASRCENLPVGEDPIQAYVGCREQTIMLPRRAPMSWIVSRVAGWYWRSGEGHRLAVHLMDYNLTQVELDREETWMRVASDPKVRSVVFVISEGGTGTG
ncbi:hypothetical protein FN846DRAFT_260151 [Sphaerosporella brunnea]|uniref:Uncharacterized protein n=1 Tax=Sphaerosporella brunnea TaxID=1250544 RepID=A0A5J5EMC0_9PEZI|nr:hypothetical protein FN846DRAFT_260151 [Sphaerosporella brunnea]